MSAGLVHVNVLHGWPAILVTFAEALLLARRQEDHFNILTTRLDEQSGPAQILEMFAQAENVQVNTKRLFFSRIASASPAALTLGACSGFDRLESRWGHSRLRRAW